MVVSLRASFPQMRDSMQFPRNVALNNAAFQPTRKSLNSAEMHYNNMKRKALGILHGPETFHHYWFTFAVSRMTDHKLLVAIVKKHSKHITETTENITTHPSIQYESWTKPLQSRLAIQTQP